MEDKSVDIEKILAERVKLDGILQSEFTRQVTIMFTDIKGSTSFYEKSGDIDGRIMVHRHNEIVLPVIEANKGVLIKTIGDATMSLYDDPADALKAAIRVQLDLKAYNKGRTAKERIHVRVGVNYGSGIVEKNDVYGDVVNVASRVESLADGGEIMVTDDLYRVVKGHDEFIFRYVDKFQVKGKEEPIKAYKLVWHEEDLSLGKLRGGTEPVHKREGMFVIEASVSERKLKISGFERTDGEERPVKSYKEMKFDEAGIGNYTKGIIELLNRANRRGKIGNELLVKLKEYGGLLYDAIIPLEIKERLAKTAEKNLMIGMDDTLVPVPWELLYDGKDFLCQRFSIGRTVSTRQSVSSVVRAISRPLKMQILADPRGDLRAAYDEGLSIKDEIDKLDDWVNVSMKTSDIKTDYVKSKIRNFDIVHYAGHAEHNSLKPEESGWLLKDGKLRAENVIGLTGVMPMPSLVFSNACQTGQSEEWRLGDDYEQKIFGLANAFLLSGVQHYIGTFWEIPDEAGAHFAKAFYRNLIKGVTVGEALRQARLALIEKYGEDTIVWAGYMLYGDPASKYIFPEMSARAAVPEEKTERASLGASIRHQEEVVHFPVAKKPFNNPVVIAAALFLVVVIAVFAFMRPGGAKGKGAESVSVEKAATVQDEQSMKRIDELVASLAARYRSGKVEAPSVKRDEWSSRPLTMVFMDVRDKEGNKAREERLVSLLMQALQDEKKVSLVERELLDKLLQELKIGSSELADPATARKLGKVLSAGIIATGSIMPEGKGLSVMLRFIDTETTEVKKMLSIELPDASLDKAAMQKPAGRISDWLRADFPVKGRIVSVSGEQVSINLGTMHGVKKGDKLEVVEEAKKGSGIYATVADLTVSEPGKDKSVAVIAGKGKQVKDGDKVRGKL